MPVRRVVTGQAADGTSVFVSDEQLEPVTVGLLPGAEFHQIWGSDEPVRLPTDGSAPPSVGWFPPPGGFRFVLTTFPPDSARPAGASADIDQAAALSEVREKLPGLLEVMEPNNPGMHTTDTVDLVLVVSGEVWLELDAGAQVHLRAGDIVVQNGTRHAWRNRSSEPCVIAGVAIGAQRAT